MQKKEKNLYIIGLSIILVLVLLIGGTYAWFTLTLNGTKVNVLKAGTLSIILNDENSIGINEDKAVPMLDEVGETLDPYHFTLENHSDIASEYTIYLDDTDLEENETRMSDSFVKYQLIKDGTKTTVKLNTIGTHPNRVLDTGTIEGNTTITYDLRLWIDRDTSNEAMGQVVRTKIRVHAIQTEPIGNQNITKIYQFDTTNCITGEEETCVELTKRPETYEAGAIIKYKVNDTEEKYFHVLYDNGNTLTLQQRENTQNKVNWYINPSGGNTNTAGPVTALQTLENATSNWTNVKEKTYTLGSTIFQTNAYTGCSWTSCTTNKYTLPIRTAKARLITAQELQKLGCSGSSQSCPVFLYNYLDAATDNGGTETGIDVGYWTASAYSSTNANALAVGDKGILVTSATSSYTYNGIRAVVEIDK